MIRACIDQEIIHRITLSTTLKLKKVIKSIQINRLHYSNIRAHSLNKITLKTLKKIKKAF
jgi:hypothetical protein